MKRIVAVTACPTGVAHTIMAAEALKQVGASMGHSVTVETQGAQGARDVLSPEAIAAADAVIIASDIHIDPSRFVGKPIHAVSTGDAIRKTKAVIEAALAESGEPEEAAPPPADAIPHPPIAEAQSVSIVGVTSCPTGIAHTFMAAEALRKAATELGYAVKIETQGSVGAKNVLAPEDIAQADAVVIAADAFVDASRFVGKPLYETTTKAALHDARQVIETALAAPPKTAASSEAAPAEAASGAPRKKASAGPGPYRHLMTGVSYMLPVVVAGGLLIALAFALGGIYVGDQKGTLGWALMQIGGATAFKLYIPVLAGFIAYSIAERPGIAPGLVGGMLAATEGAGFLGGIVAGFLAGYLTRWLNGAIRLPKNLEGLKPVLILPFLSTLVVGLLLVFVIGPPVKAILTALTDWLAGMHQASALIFGLILGGMMAVDMGGPVNKAAYTFGVGLLASNVYAPMAAVMAGGMTPPLALGLAATLFPKRFSPEEHEASKAAMVLGLAFITEGAIPFAARDPFRVIPCAVLGSAVTGALSMVYGVTLMVPHGGAFVLLIPGAVTHVAAYAAAIAIGTAVTVLALYVAKRRIPVAA
ncbi:PTS system, fructose subfamily, IIC subunit [Solidesulfovibrio fructosivorans JJ]]|uniref:protein-N(pi)-phosphohistidine--D-fructose phosphotransferase n=1 Tax=Solidesulfovibrio fructosivorans JJ] TaxID=596151 RepID=E1JSY7_SOLFR|nr:PTS fructose-like transporter subunit IIB [Solidesulfovibrio fructosivorans]EFL52620.1 PTS system, fructose subfamily, IIC subunit [Solidesulfovibrio fructosivorans JJ]]